MRRYDQPPASAPAPQALARHPVVSTTDTSALDLLLYGASPMVPSRLAEGTDRSGNVFSQPELIRSSAATAMREPITAAAMVRR